MTPLAPGPARHCLHWVRPMQPNSPSPLMPPTYPPSHPTPLTHPPTCRPFMNGFARNHSSLLPRSTLQRLPQLNQLHNQPTPLTPLATGSNPAIFSPGQCRQSSSNRGVCSTYVPKNDGSLDRSMYLRQISWRGQSGRSRRFRLRGGWKHTCCSRLPPANLCRPAAPKTTCHKQT